MNPPSTTPDDDPHLSPYTRHLTTYPMVGNMVGMYLNISLQSSVSKTGGDSNL